MWGEISDRWFAFNEWLYDHLADAGNWIATHWDRLGDWLTAHDQDADLYSVWLIVFSLMVLAGVKAVTWWTMYGQRDRTAVGVALKRQKVAEVIMFLAWWGLYALSLWVYYTGNMPVNIWGRMAIRGVVVGGSVAAAIFGVQLTLALRAQRYGRPGNGRE